jgi:fructose-1,6-bisphosphatase I
MERLQNLPDNFLVDFPTQVQLDLFDSPATMGEYVIEGDLGAEGFSSREELLRILTAIRLGAKIIAREINKGALSRISHGYLKEVNVQDEQQHSLDFYANQLLLRCLRSRNILCGVVSEEEPDFVTAGREASRHETDSAPVDAWNNHYIVLMDPLDGSSNIDVNIPVGTIFSVVRRVTPVGTPPKVSDFLQSGRAVIAAGYVLYGSSTMLVFSAGKGVHGFTLDNSIGTLYLTHPTMRFPGADAEKTKRGIYSVNEGNSNSFSRGVQTYINRCKERGQTARYVGSLVADFHRNLLKGGIYMYPAVKGKGKLRLQYEANPMAFLAEQAGGKASTGRGDVRDLNVGNIHDRCEFFVGVKEMVEELEACIAAED